jgi:hypothetical protein
MIKIDRILDLVWTPIILIMMCVAVFPGPVVFGMVYVGDLAVWLADGVWDVCEFVWDTAVTPIWGWFS